MERPTHPTRPMHPVGIFNAVPWLTTGGYRRPFCPSHVGRPEQPMEGARDGRGLTHGASSERERGTSHGTLGILHASRGRPIVRYARLMGRSMDHPWDTEVAWDVLWAAHGRSHFEVKQITCLCPDTIWNQRYDRKTIWRKLNLRSESTKSFKQITY